ncbi:hypothetical protein FNV43_RR14367 [Rhamnella rubrinervis]|uniref:PHD-type domain-containing protein n=1 Tax=Rhamnella rubrinervis TaxID=2594499 RepID=A0A8K0H303_9ROSA|nr:hypothetical protein FNV43_RR14367 [Rhamnella rubrinervis]
MELTDSSNDELRDSKPVEPARSVLGIDLNEIPSPSETVCDSFEVVRSYYDNPSPPPGGPAGVPGVSRGSACAVCGKPEVRGHVVVCDGCERGFHLGCAGMRGRQALNLDEWVCTECLCRGVKSKRWPLGVKSKRILDINASPPSDCDVEGSEEVLDLRNYTPGGNSFGGNPFGAPVTYSNFLYSGNGFGFHKASGIVTNTVKAGLEDILHHSQIMSKSFEEVDLNSTLGRCRSSSNMAVRLPSSNPSEIFLRALRDFISERHGVLDEGWRVEFKQPMGSCELYAVYCAPDGKTFDSVYEVACYLGLMSNYNSKQPGHGSLSIPEKASLPRKRKATRYPITNGFAESKEAFMGGHPLSNSPSMGFFASTFGNNAKISEAGADESGDSESQQSVEGLPVQFEDFFLLSLGKIDIRPAYHDANCFWPVGFRSCWHDKITGSVFICEVLDGGDSGPVFKVSRYSCSAFRIPIGSTVLSWPRLGHGSCESDEENDNMTCDGDIQMILTDPCPPAEDDILSCLKSCSDRTSDLQMSNGLNLEACLTHEKSGKVLFGEMGLRDEIGEISVEEHSSSAAWRMISQKLINVCSEIFKQKGSLNFFCKHVGNDEDFPNWAMNNDCSKGNYNLLDKFFSSPSSFNIPSVIQADNELESFSDILAKWLDQDRFGLDVEFVQEILEQLPGVQSCSQYQLLGNRNSYSTSLTIGSGLLVIKMGGGVQGKGKEKLDGLFRRSKKAKLVEDHVMNDRQLPLGKQLCSRVPPELVGDVYQVWELFWRFYEILGLKGPLSLEELEEELINPWFDSSDLFEKFEKEMSDNNAINPHGVEHTGLQILSSNGESGREASRENPHAFIHMETGAMKEAAQTRLASVTYSRCSGVALTKAHNSLLRVLVSELQSKVAALVDPNFDSGELKPKRGRKKDVDSSIHLKKTKLNMLPINELTWPELARRYILAVLSMDGNLESAEIAARESGKVFRCLQGDGGVLCGSLTGVAGMEADALLLAEAKKQIFGSLERENYTLTIEEEGSDTNGASEKNLVNNGSIPEWAQLLEPVRKLPTNVGTRIRKCVYDALDKNPPDWARKILEHSISKEVYKGNASGPTKKAVLSVLADVCGEGLPPKSDKRRKKKIVISVSDVIMKQCRIVLRRAAAADDSKVFCNLLGRKLINSSDNDEEGLLGSPAMVSRPLDFRTIDLRLTAGAYGGSHEAFLEDVRELWTIVRNAYADQPDLAELAETLSQNFELLYEKEVVALVHKFAEYAKSECSSVERKKEIDELLSSTSEIPKAPWDEGVCKVCGIDKDDDSVLLCDTCDAEYHTYCLNPPLARIPEGNWYCPSCILVKGMAPDASEKLQVIHRRSGKKYQGEVTRAYMEALTHLAAKMEEKEYWEFTVDERTFLLKFLCDELLNSAVIRQHLEQCAETSTELQQKLRYFSVEWKNLKSREETFVARAAKVDPSMPNAVGKVGKEGLPSSLTNYEKGLGQSHALTDRSNYIGKLADDLQTLEGGREGIGINGPDGHSSGTNSECNTQNPLDAEGQSKDVHADVDDSYAADIPMDSQENDKSFFPIELTGSNSSPHEAEGSDRASGTPGNPQYMARDVSSDPPLYQHGHCDPLDARSNNVAQHVPPVSANESQTDHNELNSIKNNISLLQESIINAESELLKVSVRREFLGSDSWGRLYWASATPSGHSRIIVDGCVDLQYVRKTTDHREKVGKGYFLKSSVPSVVDNQLHQGSKAGCPYQCERNNAVDIHSPWVSYETDSEISELIGWLKDKDPKERELKESILHWQKLRFQGFQRNRVEDQDEVTELSVASNGEKAAFSNCLITKATALLEKRYGPCFELEIPDILKKRGKKARVTNDEKMYRCECLEPIWPCRHHCFACHRSFFSDAELEGHNDGRCNSASLTCEKGKEISDSSKAKGSLKSDTNREECTGEINRIGSVKPGFSGLSAKLIKFQNEGLVCPYGFDEICSKFVTKDSNKDLIQEIGLIGSKGIPSFVPTVSPYLSDSTLALVSPWKDVGVRSDGSEAAERPLSLGNTNMIISGHASLSDRSPRKSSADGIGEVPKSHRTALGCLEQIEVGAGGGRWCVVPQSSLRPLVGKVSQILRRLKINLLDMEAMLPEEALRPSKSHLEKRWAWRGFVKSATTIYEMAQATIILEDMVKTEYLRNEWWYWSSFSAAAKISTISSLALRIYALDAAIIYEKISSNSDPTDNLESSSSIYEQKVMPIADPTEKAKVSRKSNKKRKEPEG